MCTEKERNGSVDTQRGDVRPPGEKGASVLRAGCLLALSIAPLWQTALGAVGATAGEAEATRLGSARYTVPLWTPSGTAGLEPALALTYDSLQQNGILGVGFEISGFSAITRCARTISQDGAAGPINRVQADKYCLDGNKLRLVSGSYGASGSEYRTERDDISKITASGSAGSAGPASFTVRQKSGLDYEYGTTASSRIEFVGNAAVRTWALSRIKDRSGNVVEFTYIEDGVNGSYRPDEIRYTSNPAQGISTAPYVVKFIYESTNRPDPIYRFVADSPAHEFKRLQRIEIRHESIIQRQYLFAYQTTLGDSGHSRLDSLTECAATTGDCFSPTTFDWTDSDASFGSELDSGSNIPVGFRTWHLIDTNGDGRDDLVYVSSTGTGGTWRIRQADTSGGFSAEINTGLANTNYAQSLSLEWDGDGKTDLAVPYSGNRWHIFRSNGNGFDAPFDTGITAVSAQNNTRTFDINGDGRDDLVRISTSGAATVWVRYRGTSNFGAESVLWTSGNANVKFQGGFDNYQFKYRSRLRRADLNGDGKEEFLAKLSEFNPETGQTTWAYYPFFSGAPGAPFDPFSADKGGNHLWADLNADGLTDIIWVKVAGGFSCRISTSSGLGQTCSAPGSAGLNPNLYVVADYNGDGRDDVLIPRISPADLHYLKSSGTGLQSGVSTGITGMGSVGLIYVGDLNGSGFTDLLLQKTTADAKYRLHNPSSSDLLQSAVDGFGTSASFTYAPLTKPSLHTPLTGSVWPMREFRAGIHLVEKMTISDGIGGTYDIDIAYKGARAHATGRGFLGFNERTVTDSRTGNRTIYKYEQDAVNDWERLGAVLSVTAQTSASKKFLEQTFVWNKVQSGSGNEVRRFPYVSARTVKHYEINTVAGTPNPLVSTETLVVTTDVYGTPTDITLTTTENNTGNHSASSRTISVNHVTLLNDVANWCLGRPTNTETTASHTLTDGIAITRRMDQAWDANFCRPTQKIIEPASPLWKVTAALGYDDFGNINQITVTPVGQAARVTTLDWGTDGRFLGTITNPLSQSTVQTWHEDITEVDTVTDSNGLVTTWEYDTFARVTKIVRPDGTASTTDYLACDSDCTGIANAKLKLRRREIKNSTQSIFSEQFLILDALWRDLRRTSYELGGAEIDILSQYNDEGLLHQQSQPHFHGTGIPVWTTLSYDALGRVTAATRAMTDDLDSSPATTTFSYQGLKTIVTDPLSNSTTETRHAWGTVSEVVDAANQDVDYAYDAFGNLTRTTDSGNHVIDIDYNVVGFKMSSNDPDMGQWTYDYYPLGELKSQTNARGQTVTYTYDKLSRPLTRVEPEGTTTWTWDASSATCAAGGTGGKGIGQLATVSSPGGYQEKYCYDDKGRPKFIRTVANGGNFDFAYTYHADWGVVETITYPSSIGTPFKVRYEYETANKSGLLKSVKDYYTPFTAYWQATSVDAFRQYQDIVLGNGLGTYRAFDSITGAIRGIETGPGGGTSRQQLDYVWSKAGRLTQREDINQTLTEEFDYDDLYRLTESRRNGVVNLTVAYSVDGNITSKSDMGPYNYTTAQSGCSYYSHAQPHAVRAAGSKVYCYDQNGNMTKRDGATISWTSYNLPIVINQSGGNSSTFSYGADRQRYKQVNVDGSTTETTVYVQGGLFEKITTGTATEYKHYIVGGDGPVAIHTRRNAGGNDTVYLLTDHLGSVDKITDATGAVVVSLSYDPFGKRRGANWSGSPSSGDWADIENTTHRGYTGHEHLDNLSLIHMNGRVYDPILGRFLSADPFVSEPFNGQNFNRYSYVFNSPLSYTDPSGFDGSFTRWCNDVCVEDWLDYLIDQFEASMAAELYHSFDEDPTYNGTVIPHPERMPDDDVDWKSRGKVVVRVVADFVILDSVRGAVEVYDAARAGDYKTAAIGMAGLACDVAKYCKAFGKLLSAAKDLRKARRALKSVINDSAHVADDAERAIPMGSGRSPMKVPGPQNVPTIIGGRQYTGHALDQMQGRGITPSVVEDTLARGVKTSGRDGATIFTTDQARVILNPDGSVKTVYGQ